MLKLSKYLKPFTGTIILTIVLIAVQALAELTLPDYMADIVDNGIVRSDISYVLNIGLRMLLITLIGITAAIFVGFFSSRVAAAFSLDLRNRVFTKIEGFSMNEFDKFSTASLITRTTNDVQQLQMFTVMLLRIVAMAPIMGIGGIIKALSKDVGLSWILLVSVPAIMALILIIAFTIIPRFKRVQALIDRLNLISREILTGIRVIRAFRTEKKEKDRFAVANNDLTKLNIAINKILAALNPLMMLILNLTMTAIVWFGAKRIDMGTLQVGDMMAFMQYAMQIMFSFLMVSFVFIMLPRASVSAGRVLEVLETEPSIKEPVTPKSPPQNVKGLVEFRDVSFAYQGSDEPAVRNISFTAKKGEMVALIGSTGSGKSTIINLIPRLYDVTGGSVLIDGVDVRDYSFDDLRARIGFVPQKAILFSGDIESNILYGHRAASKSEIEKAADISQSSEFISSKPGQYKSEIAQGGSNVSGGQKQRLTIARALVRRPEILVFDDSFSALDFKTDASLRAAIRQNAGDTTLIVVAQRISTIMHANLILVLDDGEIIGKGTHDELMNNCSVYKEIASYQLSQEGTA